MTSFAQWLNATMHSRGLSQADMAREIGVADAQVSRWRRGQVTPSVRYLHQLASAFDVPRVQLERMAGYPVDEAGEDIDPAAAAELEAHQARFRKMLEEMLPRELWRSYIDACEALAQRLSASFGEVARSAEREIEQANRPSGHIGFRTGEVSDDEPDR